MRGACDIIGVIYYIVLLVEFPGIVELCVSDPNKFLSCNYPFQWSSWSQWNLCSSKCILERGVEVAGLTMLSHAVIVIQKLILNLVAPQIMAVSKNVEKKLAVGDVGRDMCSIKMGNNVMILMNIKPRIYVNKIAKTMLDVMIVIVLMGFTKETIQAPAYQDLVMD